MRIVSIGIMVRSSKMLLSFMVTKKKTPPVIRRG